MNNESTVNPTEHFSTEEEDRIKAALDLVEDDGTPATMSTMLEHFREDSDIDEFDVREAAKERDML